MRVTKVARKTKFVGHTHLEMYTGQYWMVSKAFYDTASMKDPLTVSTGLQMTSNIIGTISSQKKVWRRTAALQDDIICNNKDAK